MLAAAVALAGCASLGNTGTRSKVVDAQALLPATASTHIASQLWPTERWWEMYGDPQLDALVHDAIEGSPSIRIALDRLRIAQAQSASARAGLRPKLDGSVDIDREHVSKAYIFPPPLGGGTGWNNLAALDFSYDLDLWGKARSQYEGALDEDQASSVDLRQSQLALSTALVRAYVQLWLSYAVRDVATATVHQRQSALDITRRRLSIGIASQLEASEAEAQLAPAFVLVEQANESIDTLRNQIVALAGKGPVAADSLRPPDLALDRVPALPDVIPSDLVGRRPDVVAARWHVMAAGKNIDVATAQFYPDINLTATIGLQAISMASFLTGDAVTYGAGPAIRLPIFEGGKLRANLESRNGEYDLAVDRYNEVIINAFRDVADDLVAVRSGQKQTALAQAAVTDAQRALNQSTAGFKAGISDYLNVLTAQNVLLQQQQTLARVNAATLDAKAQLAQALGGGFEDDSNSDAVFRQTLAEHASPPSDEAARFPSLSFHGH